MNVRGYTEANVERNLCWKNADSSLSKRNCDPVKLNDLCEGQYTAPNDVSD